ncbi:MAG: HD domain-containing protein [Blautia sp.]
MTRLEQQMGFIAEIDKVKSIFRQTYISDGSRKENDAEHSWHLAIMAALLEEYAPEGTEIARVMKMVLVHDLVEIDAGDTFAYDEKAAATQREREVAAADRIFQLLPTDQAEEYRAVWDEFEDRMTKESKFAHALDNCQPLLLNAASGGKSWKEHQVKKSQILKRNLHTPADAPKLWEFMEQMIEEHIARGNIIDE